MSHNISRGSRVWKRKKELSTQQNIFLSAKQILLSSKKYFAKLLHVTFLFFGKIFFFTINAHELANSKFIAIFLINWHIFSQVSLSICFNHSVLKISWQATVWRVLKYDYYIPVLKYTKRKTRIKTSSKLSATSQIYLIVHLYTLIYLFHYLSAKKDIPIYPKSVSTETPLSWFWPNIFWFQSEFSGWP